jgi:protein phosphatase inhibitor 2
MDIKMATEEEAGGSVTVGDGIAGSAAAAAVVPVSGSGSGSNTPGRSSVKPALKRDSDAVAAAAADAADHDNKQNKEHRHLKWDEKAIEEHDQLRGTRMKIDEPNTPYAQYDSGAESDDSRRPKSPACQKPTLSWDVLQTRLDSVAAVRDAYPSSPSSHATGGHDGDDHDGDGEHDHADAAAAGGSGGGGGDERKSEMRKLEFREHRKRHYNEAEALRKFREEHPGGSDDVEDEGDDADAEKD